MNILEHAKKIVSNTILLESNISNYKIYIHYLPENNKGYIGQTKQLPKKRWKKGKKYEHNIYFTNAINKYGWDSFEHVVLIENLNLDQADQLETTLITSLKTNIREFGYNIANGGGNKSHNEETRKRISVANTGRIVPPHIGAKISAGLKEYYRNNTREYRELDPSHKKAISRAVNKRYEDPLERTKQSQAIKKSYEDNPQRKINLAKSMEGINLGRKHTPETRRNMSLGARNRKHRKQSLKTKQILREKNLGKNNPMYGMTGSKNPNAKSIYGIHKKTGDIVYFNTVKEATEHFNLVNHSPISNCLNGRSKSSCGYTWFYQ